MALADRLLELGHEVRMGSRVTGGPASSWAESARERASSGDFAQAAEFGELIINATAGASSLDGLRQAGAQNLAGKVPLDVANPIGAAEGPWPVTLTVANTDSPAEQIQREFSAARVVKALNTMNCTVMVRPEIVPDEHVVFLCGDDTGGEQTVAQLLCHSDGPKRGLLTWGAL